MRNIVLDFDEEKVNVVIEKKRNKNLYLRFHEDGVLYCTVPYRMSETEMMKFILSKKKWILDSKKKIEKKKIVNSELNDKEIYIFGVKKDVVYAYSKKAYIEETDTSLYIFAPKHEQEYLEKLFRNYASKKILELVANYRSEWDEKICERYDIPLPEIKVRYMKSRWGVCYPSKHLITMSTRLIHYQVEAFEYVLLHEYVHFLVQNHSSKFYDYVKTYMPQYKVYNNYLR